MKFSKDVQDKLNSYRKAQRELTKDDDLCTNPHNRRRVAVGGVNGKRVCNKCFGEAI